MLSNKAEQEVHDRDADLLAQRAVKEGFGGINIDRRRRIVRIVRVVRRLRVGVVRGLRIGIVRRLRIGGGFSVDRSGFGETGAAVHAEYRVVSTGSAAVGTSFHMFSSLFFLGLFPDQS